MKYIFVINDFAGKGLIQKSLKEEINNLSQDFDCSFYVTLKEGDATNYIKEYLKKYHEEVCFIACGGDGTINEVFNGAYNNKQAYVSIYPCGSGNDLVKVFKDYSFTNIKDIINSNNYMNIDLMKVEDRYADNVINIGFDTTVAEEINKKREKTGHGDKFAYTKGIFKALFNSMKTKIKIYVDNELLNPSGEILLCSFANGQYYGGAYKCAPNAKIDDGLIEVCIVNTISRFKLLSLIKAYKDGKHLNNDKFKDIVIYRQAKEILIKSEKEFAYTVDGEILYAKEIKIEIIPQALKLILPNNQ